MGLSLDEFYRHPDAEDHIAVWENEQQVCRHHGGPISECPDDEKDWFPQRHICYVEMQLKAAQRAYDERHKAQSFHNGTFTHWSEKWSPYTPFHYMDGVTLWMSEVELSPDDNFLG